MIEKEEHTLPVELVNLLFLIQPTIRTGKETLELENLLERDSASELKQKTGKEEDSLKEEPSAFLKIEETSRLKDAEEETEEKEETIDKSPVIIKEFIDIVTSKKN